MIHTQLHTDKTESKGFLTKLQGFDYTDNKPSEYFRQIDKQNAYIPTPDCLFDYITKNTKLSKTDKIIFLHIYSISFFNHRNNKERTVAKSLRNTSEKLNISKAQVFASQKKLEELGLFSIKRQKNQYNQNKPNLITPCVSNKLFAVLDKEPKRAGVDTSFSKQESNLDYLERTKQFINLNYGILKYLLEHDTISPACKILSIDLFIMWYKYHLSTNKKSGFKFLVNYKQLMSRHSCSLKAISTNMITLEKTGIISRKQIFIKNGEERNARHDKSVWEITFNFPDWYKNTQSPKTINTDTLYTNQIESELSSYEESSQNSLSYAVGEHRNKDGVFSLLLNKLKVLKNITPSFDKFFNYFSKKNCVNYANSNASKVISKVKLENTPNIDDLSNVNKTDRGMSPNRTHYNKDKIIKTFKSNLESFSKVIFNKKTNKQKSFNVANELIEQKIKEIPKEKADKARMFAYALVSKGLSRGINKHELAKQFIFHAATWKPNKLGSLSQNNKIDVALAVAWKAVTNGTWRTPLGWQQVNILQLELDTYAKKHEESGIISAELPLLESDVRRVLGKGINLRNIIINKQCSKEINEDFLLNIPKDFKQHTDKSCVTTTNPESEKVYDNQHLKTSVGRKIGGCFHKDDVCDNDNVSGFRLGKKHNKPGESKHSNNKEQLALNHKKQLDACRQHTNKVIVEMRQRRKIKELINEKTNNK